MKERLVLIEEYDYEDQEQSVLGIADSLESAEKMIARYYGEYEQIAKYSPNGEDYSLAYTEKLKVDGLGGSKCEVLVTLRYFTINKI